MKPNEIGRRYGRLTVVSPSDNPRCVNCVCDCGKTCTVDIYNLRSGNTKSCGCLKEDLINLGKQYHTNPMIVISNKVFRNNRLGVRGVVFNPKRNKYRAYITMNHHTKYLGHYNSIVEAIDARKQAEEKYFAPIRNEYLSYRA